MRRLQRAGFRAARKRIGKMPRERLRKHLRGPLRRRIVLRAIFTVMPRAVRGKALARENLVVEFRLTGARDGRPDVRQLVIEGGTASVFVGEPREAELEITIDAADFLRVATGNAAAPALYVNGEIEIYGDPWLAMRLPRLFAIAGSKVVSGL